eukprot:m.42335 g.42335  ORF g.42335 m.42335 type:complete len:305 (-) comp9871_c0_seq2:3398-4312(-)
MAAVLKVFAQLTLPLYGILVPIGTVLAAMEIPLKVMRMILGQQSKTSPMKVDILAPTSKAKDEDVLFIHGWPDSGAMFMEQARVLQSQGYRCIILTLPNAESEGGGGWGASFDEILLLIYKATRENCKGKVILFAHDWGAHHAYHFRAKYPDLVKCMIVLDIAQRVDMTAPRGLAYVSYQTYLALAFLYGGYAGDWMVQNFYGMMKNSARPKKEVRAYMGFYYYYFWKQMILDKAKLIAPRVNLDECPVLFVYGAKQPFTFTSKKFLNSLENHQNSAAHPLPCGHWITEEKGKELSEIVTTWLS